MVQIMQLLGVVPSDLLLLFKTSDCLRHLDLLLESDLNTSAGMFIYANSMPAIDPLILIDFNCSIFVVACMSIVAASVVAEVLLKEDIDASYNALSESYYHCLAQYLSAYTKYYGIQTRLTGYYLLGWIKYVNSFWE